MTDSNWRTQSFRDNIVSKLNDHIQAGGVPMKTDANQMESNIFHKARSEHEYLAYIARLIVYIRDKSRSEAAHSQKAAATTTTINDELSSIDEENCGDDDDLPTTEANAVQMMAPTYRPPSPPPMCVSLVAMPALPINCHLNNGTNGHNNSNQRRPEPNASQKRDILKTAIATVLQNPGWRCDPATIRPQVHLFGQYVSAQLSQIEDEDVLVSTQQKVMALLNKAV